jgi:uncharacterized protein YndB with AHSA1/START domain
MSQESMTIEKSIVIDRPVERVWECIADGRKDPLWCDKVASVEQVAGEGPGPDAAYRVVHRPVRLKKPKELTVTVEEFDPPRRMRIREEDDDGVFNVVYGLERFGEGTRLTQRDQIAWKIPRFQRPIARRMVSADIERQLSVLKSLLERSG